MAGPVEDEKTRVSVWVWVGAGLSVVYIGGLLKLVWWLGLESSWHDLTLNTLGDAMAGAFAPLAFLWLFVATMVQSQELTLQRRELRDSRKVSTEQALEAKRTAEFIGAQTELLKMEAERRTAEAGDKELDVKVEAFGVFLASIAGISARFGNDVTNIRHLNLRENLPHRYADLILTCGIHRSWFHSLSVPSGGQDMSSISLRASQRDEWIMRLEDIAVSKPITIEAARCLAEAHLEDITSQLRVLVVRDI